MGCVPRRNLTSLVRFGLPRHDPCGAPRLLSKVTSRNKDCRSLGLAEPQRPSQRVPQQGSKGTMQIHGHASMRESHGWTDGKEQTRRRYRKNFRDTQRPGSRHPTFQSNQPVDTVCDKRAFFLAATPGLSDIYLIVLFFEKCHMHRHAKSFAGIDGGMML